MPRIKEGGGGKKGSFWVRPYEISDDLLLPRAGGEGVPQLRVMFQVRGDDPEEMDTVSLGIPLDEGEAFNKIQALIPNLQPNQVSGDETELRRLMDKVSTEWRLAWVNKNFVQSFTATPGTHRGTFHDMFLFNRASDGERRVSVILKNAQGFESSWTMPWGSAVYCTVGATPKDDEIEFFPSKAIWKALIALGFDYDGFKTKLKKAPALFTAVDLDGEVLGFFANPEDITPEIMSHFENPGTEVAPLPSSKKVVQWVVTDDKKYGIGPLRGDYAEVELAEVIIDDAPFQREMVKFLSAWDTLTQVVGGDESLRFAMGDTMTNEGTKVAAIVMVPVIGAYPDVVQFKKPDGSPSITLPPSSEKWNLNGLVCMSLLAQRILKEDTVLDIVNETEQLMAWVNLEVGELQGDLAGAGEEVEL